MISIYRPYLTEENLKHAHEALDSTWISSKGKYIGAAQEKLQEILGVKHVLLTNNGTSALHLVSRVIHRLYPGKRGLITGNNHYVAAWNAWEYESHFRLSTVDADSETWNMDLESLPEDHWATVISVVHNLGNIVDVPALKLKYPKAIIVEDACEAFGGLYGLRYAGTESFASALSFYGNKNITAGEGGAFLTNSDEAFNLVKRMWGQGQSSQRFIHSELGFNYRMTNIQAAILYGQLKDFPEIFERKQAIWVRYREQLKDWVEYQKWEMGTQHSLWMFGIRVPGGEYGIAEKFFKRQGVEIRPMFYPITKHGHYKKIRGVMKVAEDLSRECIILPSYPELTNKDQDYVIDTVKKYVEYI